MICFGIVTPQNRNFYDHLGLILDIRSIIDRADDLEIEVYILYVNLSTGTSAMWEVKEQSDSVLGPLRLSGKKIHIL